VYLIQHYVIEFVSNCHDITEILLKVALNTITLNSLYISIVLKK